MTDISLQPKAPKDPIKKGASFYIMRGKDIFAQQWPGGKGMQPIYESDGRLESSARLVGNIEDEEILALLGSTEGFKKLIRQIGVSIEAEDLNEYVDFCFQMYGHTDPYVSGTTIRKTVKADGSESLINLDEVEWSDDDNIPGQIRFEFSRPGIAAKASVRFYLNDGFNAPEPEEEEVVDFNSEAYKAIVKQSLMIKGNTYRVKKAIEKARSGKDTCVAFIGGSITQGAGAIPINTNCYARKAYEGFCDVAGVKYDTNVNYVKAGLGGTPSELGLTRYEMDVLEYGKNVPDLVVVEFAVNDAGDETEGRCYDSLVRKIWNGPGNPAVVLLFSVFQDDYNLQERLLPVGKAYDLPTVSIKECVTPQFYLKAGEGRVVSKLAFFYDCYHPTNTGHRIMADCLINMFKEADVSAPESDTDLNKITPPIGGQFEDIIFFDRKVNTVGAVIDCADFTKDSDEIHYAERKMDLFGSKEFPNNWMHDGGSDKPFTVDVECKSLMIVYMDSASPSFTNAKVYADGEEKITIDPHIVGWTHANALIVFEEEKTSKHHVEVKLDDYSKKFTILGFAVVK